MLRQKSMADLLKTIFAVSVAVVYPYIEKLLGTLTIQTVDLRWQYISIGLLFFYAVAIIFTVTIKERRYLLLSCFLFLVLICVRYHCTYILSRIDALFAFVLLIMVFDDIYKVQKAKKE